MMMMKCLSLVSNTFTFVNGEKAGCCLNVLVIVGLKEKSENLNVGSL